MDERETSKMFLNPFKDYKMTTNEAIDILTDTLNQTHNAYRVHILHKGYAFDIITSMVNPECEGITDQDCDTLFRTLVLDEGYTPEQAEKLYKAAMCLVNESE